MRTNYLPERVKLCLKENNTSITKLSEEIQCNPLTIFNWITGMRVPSKRLFRALVKKYPKYFQPTIRALSKSSNVYICYDCCEKIASKLNVPSNYVSDLYYLHNEGNKLMATCWNCKSIK